VSKIKQLQAQLDELRAEFDAYCRQMAAEVRTGRLVVVDDVGEAACVTVEPWRVEVIAVADGHLSSVRMQAHTEAAVVEAGLTVNDAIRTVADADEFDRNYTATLYAGTENEPGSAYVALNARGDWQSLDATDEAAMKMAKTIEMFRDRSPIALAEILHCWRGRH